MTPCWFHGDDMNFSWRGGAYGGEVGCRRVFTRTRFSGRLHGSLVSVISAGPLTSPSPPPHLLLTSSGLVKLRRAEGGQKALASESGGRRGQEGGVKLNQWNIDLEESAILLASCWKCL